MGRTRIGIVAVGAALTLALSRREREFGGGVSGWRREGDTGAVEEVAE